MRFTAVVCTYNRAESLRQTLLALRHQTYTDFEVLVVNGPSTDGTERVLTEFGESIRSFRCSKPQLAMARNIGIMHAAGDVVAFLDDDALPENTWLEELAHTYSADPSVGAVGGIVYDHTGTKLQYLYAVCTRDGRPSFNVEPPLDQYTYPQADPFLYLQGTNMSYSRKLLREMGGFDENILHYFDDVETCMQVIDRGYRVVSLPGAGVHHKFLASHIRNHDRIMLDPYNLMTDRCYFSLRCGRSTRSTREIIETITVEADRLRKEAEWHHRDGRMTEAQLTHYRTRLDEALAAGMKKGLCDHRMGNIIPSANPNAFLPYPTRQPTMKRLRVCFVTREYPPGDFGGPARCTAELATGFAQAGHEAHVITRSPDVYRVDFESGVWVHRIPTPDRWVPELAGEAGLMHLAQVATVYREVTKLHEQNPVDLVLAPLWLCEGLVCGFDPRFPTVTTLVTAMKAVSTLADWAKQSREAQQLVAMEEETIARGRHFHAVSTAILDRSVTDYQLERRHAFVAPLAISDRRSQYPRQRKADGRVRILFVARLEARKGAEVMIESALQLCREFPHVEVILAGKDTIPTDQGDTLRSRFETTHGQDTDLVARIRFTGLVSEDELYQHYADADIFCLPTFYESFGLVYVEAMTFGLPLVGSRVGGVPEVVADSAHGFLVPPGDIIGITDALRRLIVNPELRAEFGQRSRQRYESQFAPAVVVRKLEPELARIVAQHRAQAHGSTVAEHVASRFGEVIAKVTARPLEQARSAAERLLDPTCFPVDYAGHMQRIATAPAKVFITECYSLFQGRDVLSHELTDWIAQLDRTMTRMQLIEELIENAKSYHPTPNVCLESIRAVFPASGLSPDVEATDDPSGSYRHRLSQLPILGKGFRYVRRAVMLPWNFHKLYQAFVSVDRRDRERDQRQTAIEVAIAKQLLPMMQDLATEQKAVRELLARLQVAVATGHQETRKWIEDRTPIQVASVRLKDVNLTPMVPIPEPLPEPSRLVGLLNSSRVDQPVISTPGSPG